MGRNQQHSGGDNVSLFLLLSRISSFRSMRFTVSPVSLSLSLLLFDCCLAVNAKQANLLRGVAYLWLILLFDSLLFIIICRLLSFFRYKPLSRALTLPLSAFLFLLFLSLSDSYSHTTTITQANTLSRGCPCVALAAHQQKQTRETLREGVK